ncbi:hypothetical protein ACIQZB_37410 [Streptomyces sp. NPDC097727]|uniref:hypothetical protein n=1 Tax=Streptomyces sp. NPDC097727 TaxID=3366092 RepID=UPI00381578A2
MAASTAAAVMHSQVLPPQREAAPVPAAIDFLPGESFCEQVLRPSAVPPALAGLGRTGCWRVRAAPA